MKSVSNVIIVLLTVLMMSPLTSSAQKFIHPGIDQTLSDLQYMKSQVQANKQPWKDAFDRLKEASNLNIIVKPYAHIIRGPYGKPNIGGDDLSKGANMAYNCALMWYITLDRAYANKAIEIINSWSPFLKDFDNNDARLLAGWTGHIFCNAAEILRYTDSGWKQSDQEHFTAMLMTVYYPLMRYYYPSANGNWDGAMIHSILAIAIYTDNRDMFDNAIDHFLHAPVNGSIFKYVYPSGQCQETMRDQGHVQLGLGEFAGAARVAFTQGVDLFSIANNRIGLGYEYTAGLMFGNKPFSYGKISEKSMTIRDDYEYVFQHYLSFGIRLPNSGRAADSIRTHTTRSVLTAFRAPVKGHANYNGNIEASKIAFPSGAVLDHKIDFPSNAVFVSPGESLQKALDAVAGTNRWVVAKAGLHMLTETLKIPSGITLSGEGRNTVLFLTPTSGVRDAIINADKYMHNVTIQNLLLEGEMVSEKGSDPNSSRSWHNTGNRGGIMFVADNEGDMKNINFINLTVQGCTFNGVYVNGASNVKVENCDFNESGGSVAPGAKLLHNLLICHSNNIAVKDSRLDTSPLGSGVAFDHCNKVSVAGCEVARNGFNGITLMECQDVSIVGNLIEGNDRSGVLIEFLYNGSVNVAISKNTIHYNNGFGIESYGSKNVQASNNAMIGNGNTADQQKIRENKTIIMK
jgi:parallel beta-helix repeat protein